MNPLKKKTSRFPLKLHFLLGWAALVVYLFVSAPVPLPDGEERSKERQIPINQLFELLQQENDMVRKLWTKEIVGAGQKQGLKFREDWKETGVEAGPLPALFLRETASRLEKEPIPLSLFLGSDAPINKANAFDAIQEQKFQIIKKERLPQFFYSADIERYTGMFPDIASVEPCVKCHNEHPDTPKKDWVLLDVMGATTWLYPAESVSLEEALSIIAVLRAQFKDVYETYLEKTKTFSDPPLISEQWPREGYFLPTSEEFMDAVEEASSKTTLRSLFKILNDKT